MSVAVRIGLAAVAAAAIVWLALAFRASRFEARGIDLATRPHPLVVPSLKALLDAEANNADTRPLLLQGELFIFAGQPRRAIAPLEAVVRREPENFEGWRLLANAAASSGDKGLAARAGARATALSPPVPGQ